MKELKVHPDLGGQQWSAALLNEAYETLRDNRRRSEYDRKQKLIFLKGATRPETRRQNKTSGRTECRGMNRISRAQPLRYSFSNAGAQREARLIDVSPGGAGFECSESIREEQTVQLNSPMFHATAKVKHCGKRLSSGKISYRVSTEFISVAFRHRKGSFVSTAV